MSIYQSDDYYDDRLALSAEAQRAEYEEGYFDAIMGNQPNPPASGGVSRKISYTQGYEKGQAEKDG